MTLAEGTYDFLARADDSEYKSDCSAPEFLVTVDRTAPDVSLTAPSPTPSPGPEVRVVARDPIGVPATPSDVQLPGRWVDAGNLQAGDMLLLKTGQRGPSRACRSGKCGKRCTTSRLIVYGPHLDEVARHRLLPPHAQGQRSVQPQHPPQPNDRLRRATLEERFAELGATGPRFLAGLIQTRRCGWDQAQRVLELLTIYGRVDLQAALERAVRFGAFSLSAVQRILSATARPKPVLEVLADEERRRLDPLLRADPVPPRPLSDYQPLCPEGDTHGQTSQAPDQPAAANPRPDDGPPSTPADGPGRPESGGDR